MDFEMGPAVGQICSMRILSAYPSIAFSSFSHFYPIFSSPSFPSFGDLSDDDPLFSSQGECVLWASSQPDLL